MTDHHEHAAEVTARLREDEQPLGLAPTEAICPRCTLAFFVREGAFSWGICPDCLADAVSELEPVPQS